MNSYPKIYNLGHPQVDNLLKEAVTVEEKVDGSQFSFGKFRDAEGNLALRIRSKGAEMVADAPEKMFSSAVDTAKRLFPQLQEGWCYRGEVLCKPKHNVLVYERTPVGNVILFDISTSPERYLSYEEKKAEAERLGLEVVPLLYRGMVESLEKFRELLSTTSILGGQKIEGVVVKNYARFGIDGKTLMGKFVSEAFKEIHSSEWKNSNPSPQDILTLLISAHRTPARWAKALQHLAERSEIEHSPRDIGKLMKEAQSDILVEEEENLKNKLWAWAKPHVLRGSIAGLPEWYKDLLLKRQFEEKKDIGDTVGNAEVVSSGP